MLGWAMTTTWYVEFSATPPTGVDRPQLEEHLEAVLVELDKLDGVTDADAFVDYSEPRVVFSMAVRAADHTGVVGQVVSSMRTAIHAAGGGTKGWEKVAERMSAVSRYDIRREDVPV
ncbi:hypothetical protein DFR74_1252 [Nocardia puris]|uniref:Uncharacterized protein n=3 Tax=Nocardia puris TaxID=208602 RepID=A0A366CW34_9NOCA|nr:hypothetical protein DFR74_1252 [Nocardia puris]